MLIRRLVLENFRNFKNLDLELDQGFVVLVGPNGAGKTSFLESLYFTTSLRRFPESSLYQLFYDGEKHFQSQLFGINDEEFSLGVVYERNEKSLRSQFKINNQQVQRKQFINKIPTVSFLPQDLGLLTRSPGDRRRYLDETLGTLSVDYRHHLEKYNQALKQRNELWKKTRAGEARLDDLVIWDEQLAEHGSKITAWRLGFFQYLDASIGPLLGQLSPHLRNPSFLYHNSAPGDRAQFLEAIFTLRKHEQELGQTCIGPHRDDFEVLVEGRRASGFLSRGQMRGATLALKILEKRYLEEGLGVRPVFLLDDVFSEFDQEHQEKLIEYLNTFSA